MVFRMAITAPIKVLLSEGAPEQLALTFASRPLKVDLCPRPAPPGLVPLAFTETSSATSDTTVGGDSDDGSFSDSPGEGCVFCMRNIPNKWTRARLLALLNANGFNGKYTFVYFPIDFRTSRALGYAFVCLESRLFALQFKESFEGFDQWSGGSKKVCTVDTSKEHRSLTALIQHFRDSTVMHEAVPDEFRPVLLENGVHVPMPPPTRCLKRPGSLKRDSSAA